MSGILILSILLAVPQVLHTASIRENPSIVESWFNGTSGMKGADCSIACYMTIRLPIDIPIINPDKELLKMRITDS